jgi:hypothetical protein
MKSDEPGMNGSESAFILHPSSFILFSDGRSKPDEVGLDRRPDWRGLHRTEFASCPP